MRVQVNGEPREVEAGSTISALLATLGLADRPVAVERNAEIVPRAQHASTLLNEGDRLELVQFVGGG
jgi:sulfur carrier protein